MKGIGFLLCICLAVTAGQCQSIYVAKVIDGDTFKDSLNASYRLIGIDAPEKHQQGGYESTQFLDSLIARKRVKIITDNKYDTVDFFRRKLCYVYYNDMDVNKLLVQTGHAIAYTKYPFARMQEYIVAGKEKQPEKNQSQIEDNNLLDHSRSKLKVIILASLVILLIVIATLYLKK